MFFISGPDSNGPGETGSEGRIGTINY